MDVKMLDEWKMTRPNYGRNNLHMFENFKNEK
jgi:hypothetical protein